MNIQRQYRLPNCGLNLEGFSGDGSLTSQEARPVLSILTNVTCDFKGNQETISGGRELLENLVAAVSAYTQQFLSGLPHQQALNNSKEWVSLDSAENGLHRLGWQSEEKKQEIKLTTIELFDLTEAIDQFLRDSSTLPDLKLKLKPLSRRDRTREESLLESVTPASLGLGTVAVAAIALSWLPLPPPRPVEPTPQENPSQTLPVNPQTTPPTPPQ